MGQNSFQYENIKIVLDYIDNMKLAMMETPKKEKTSYFPLKRSSLKGELILKLPIGYEK